MKVETFKCDECGKQRDKDTNHWYSLDANQRDTTHLITLKKFDPADAAKIWEHICGQECLQKAINRTLVIL